MKTECYPVSILPHLSRIFLDYVESRERLAPFYAVAPFPGSGALLQPEFSAEQRTGAADLLLDQAARYVSSPAVFKNIERLREGASAIVTGQQVGLFGGPLLTLLKAATAIRLAQDASAAGRPHVPIFWMATEDHDFDEVSHITFPSRHALERMSYGPEKKAAVPVGGVHLDEGIRSVLDQAAAYLGGTSFFEQLEKWYAPGVTMATAFGSLIAHVFAPWGLVVLDASSREAHRLGAGVLKEAVTRAEELHAALLARDAELVSRGYHAQVLVTEQSSLLFLLDVETGARLPLRRVEGVWKAGARAYREAELLDILEREPERISPNALLRPVFQDAILPTSAYVGGPAEIAYFAQSEVLYQRLLGRTTPILPRLSATLIEPAVATVLERHEVSLPQVLQEGEPLAQRLGARAMPVQGKQRLAAAGQALDEELSELTSWMSAMDESLGRAAAVSASKMRYQMNRLRRLAANYQLQKDESLKRHAEALRLALFPARHPQERLIGGAYYVARYGEEVARMLVDAADSTCPGHKGIWLS